METLNVSQLVVKLVMLGDSRVGKSSIAVRYIKNEFNQYNLSTIGGTYITHGLTINNRRIRFEMWDTAGQERYKALAPLYYKGTSAALIVYDITDYQSYINAKQWIKELHTNEGKHVIIALVGNKVDLQSERQVIEKDAFNYAKENNFLFFETSAKNNINIKQVFYQIAITVANNPSSQKKQKQNKVLFETSYNQKITNKKCCIIL